MKKFLAAFAAVLPLLVACSKDRPAGHDAQQTQVTVLEALQEAGATKATYDGSGIRWDSDDALSVFPAGSSASVKFSKKSGDNNYFTAEGSYDLQGLYALYPYSSSASLSDGTIYTTIKTIQTATPGSFDPDANISVAYSPGGNHLQFKNAVSYIKVSYKTTAGAAAIKKITFTTLDGAKLSGYFSFKPVISDGAVTDVTVATARPGAAGGVSYVTLSGDILPDTEYYLVVAPVNLSRGYRIEFVDSDGNKFMKDYTAAKNKAQLHRNTISATGVKNLDNYTINVQAYWRVTSADDFTGDEDKYLLVKNTSASATGYRVFDESGTDVFISTGQPLGDKFAGGTISGLPAKLSSWKTGGSAPLFMSHYVLYCFRDAYADDGLQLGASAAEAILNPDDAYAFTVSSDNTLGNIVTFQLCYNYSGNKATPVTLTNCYLEDKGSNTFKLWGKITQESIDGLVDVFFLSKGSQFTAAISTADIHSGADRAVNAFTQIGFCSTEVTTIDENTTINNCFMIKNYYLCNYPDPESVLIYKKARRQITYSEYYRLFDNN